MAKDINIEQILNYIKSINSKLDSIDKQLTFIGTEREILEDVRVGQVGIKELLLNHRTHLDNKIDDVKGEVIEQNIKTGERIENASEKIENTNYKIDEVKKEVKVTQDQNKEIIKNVDDIK